MKFTKPTTGRRAPFHPGSWPEDWRRRLVPIETPPFQKMVTKPLNHRSPEQKATLLNQLVAALGPQLSQTIAAGGLGSLAGALSKGNVTPQQASQVPPEQVEVLAQKAAEHDPSIMEKAAGFYAQHPTLVKAIGAASLAFLISRMSRGRR